MGSRETWRGLGATLRGDGKGTLHQSGRDRGGKALGIVDHLPPEPGALSVKRDQRLFRFQVEGGRRPDHR